MAVDGGQEYARRLGHPDKIKELSIYESLKPAAAAAAAANATSTSPAMSAASNVAGDHCVKNNK